MIHVINSLLYLIFYLAFSVHFSNVGLAKAAMESVNGFNLFGEHGAAWTVVYVDIDAHMRNRTVFENLIPRESRSKVLYCFICHTFLRDCFRHFRLFERVFSL